MGYVFPIYPIYKQVITHLLTIHPNFQRDIQVATLVLVVLQWGKWRCEEPFGGVLSGQKKQERSPLTNKHMYDVCSLSLSFCMIIYIYTHIYTHIFTYHIYTYIHILYMHLYIAIENHYILLFSSREIHCEKVLCSSCRVCLPQTIR